MPDDLSTLSAEALVEAYDRLADVEAHLGRVEGRPVRSPERLYLRAELLRRLRQVEQQTLALEGWAEVAGRRLTDAPPSA